jgi:hypothetical protein
MKIEGSYGVMVEEGVVCGEVECGCLGKVAKRRMRALVVSASYLLSRDRACRAQ